MALWPNRVSQLLKHVPLASATLCRSKRVREVGAASGATTWAVRSRLEWSAASITTSWQSSTGELRLIGARLSALSTSTGHAGARRTGAGRGCRRRVNKRPLVVMRTSFIQTNRLIGTLARHADDAAACGADRCYDSSRLRAAAGLLSSAALAAGRRRLRLTLRNRHEVAARDRILVLLPKEMLLHQDVEIRWIRVGEATLKHPDGVCDLLAAKNQLFFFLALRKMLPHGHCGRHHDGHHGHSDNQGGHGVSPFFTPLHNALTR